MRRNLLRAVLERALALHALLLALVLASAITMHVGPRTLLFVALTQLGCAATVAATTLGSFGDEALPGWGMGVLLTFMGVLAAASTFVPLFTTLGKHPLGADATSSLAITWAAAAVALLWLGQRGWHGMRQRPHPFLPN